LGFQTLSTTHGCTTCTTTTNQHCSVDNYVNSVVSLKNVQFLIALFSSHSHTLANLKEEW
jgi:hypothetical protein